MKNTAKQQQMTLHLIGLHVMWGLEQQYFKVTEFGIAANENQSSAALPESMPEKKERVKPSAEVMEFKRR